MEAKQEGRTKEFIERLESAAESSDFGGHSLSSFHLIISSMHKRNLGLCLRNKKIEENGQEREHR